MNEYEIVSANASIFYWQIAKKDMWHFSGIIILVEKKWYDVVRCKYT